MRQHSKIISVRSSLWSSCFTAKWENKICKIVALRTGNIPPGTGTLLGVHQGVIENEGSDLSLDWFWPKIVEHLPAEDRHLTRDHLLEHGYLFRAFPSFGEACTYWPTVAHVTCFGLKKEPPLHIWEVPSHLLELVEPWYRKGPSVSWASPLRKPQAILRLLW